MQPLCAVKQTIGQERRCSNATIYDRRSSPEEAAQRNDWRKELEGQLAPAPLSEKADVFERGWRSH